MSGEEWPSGLSRLSWKMEDEELETLKRGQDTEEAKEEEAASKKQKTENTIEKETEEEETTGSMFLKGLVNKKGETVEEAALQGKIVLLYFSSSWCPGCVKFTPTLSVLFEEDEDDTFAVIYVSSDDTEEQYTNYYQKKHAEWFALPFDSEKEQRQALKQKYGVFAGKEQPVFPDTSRRSGIPTLVVVDPTGKEMAMLDCDSDKVIQEIQSKGVDFLKQWEDFKWT